MKSKLEFYDTIDKFPLERFNAFNKYVMLDTELGSTVQDFDKTVIRIAEFMNKEMKEEANRELQNLRFVLNNVLSGNNTKGLAYACTIKKIDGVLLDDFSEDNLKRILKELDLTVGEVEEHNSEVKKK